jgi:hypothetical protein
MIITTRARFIALLGIVSFISTNSFGAESTVQIHAVTDVIGLYYHNNGDETQQTLSNYQKEYGISSSGHILIDYTIKSENNLKYGSKFSIQHTSKNDRAGSFSMYVESNDYGKLELGSDKSVAAKNIITGYKSSCAYGNGWDAFVVTSPKLGPNSRVAYITNFSNFIDSKTRMGTSTEYARKISYYTPKFKLNSSNTMQLGISYIPDTSNNGNGNLKDVNHYNIIKSSKFRFSFKDGIACSFINDWHLLPDMILKLSLTSERAKVIAVTTSNNIRTNIPFLSLKTSNIGMELTYNLWSIAASYMNYHKSITNKNIDILGQHSYVYSIGTKYQFKDSGYSTSINYFYSNNKNNILNVTTGAIDYIITKGFKIYAQLSYFNTNGRYINYDLIKHDTTKGALIIIGSKITL